MELYIIILKEIMNRKMKGIKVKDLKIESALCGLPKFLDRVKKVLGS